jgi:hypothetical protein
MPKYRWVVIKYPDGRKVRVIVEEQEFNKELMQLQRLYGIRYRFGPWISKDVLADLRAQARQDRLRGRKMATPRPLSPDMGRGSGGPV